MSRIIIAALIVCVVAALTVAGLRERPIPPLSVQLGQVREGAISRIITSAGKIEAVTTVKISSNLSGMLIALPVQEGEKVKKNKVLAKVDPRRFEAAVRQASASVAASRAEIASIQAEAARLERDFKRIEDLVAKGLASAAELDEGRSVLQVAQARLQAQKARSLQAMAALDEARQQLGNTVLLSPIDGTVLEISREVGERVRGSDFNEDVVMTLAALHSMEVHMEVNEYEVIYLKEGQQCAIEIDALEGRIFTGSVAEIAQKALIRNPGTEQETTHFPVAVALSSKPPAVYPGMSAQVRIVAESRTSTRLVPVQAIAARVLDDASTLGEQNALSVPKKRNQFVKVVFVVGDDSKAHARRVKTGISSDTDVEVLEGLHVGDTIVLGPYRILSKKLKDGDTVRPMKP